MTRRTVRPPVPRIESLRVENYRALKSLDLKQITPLTVLLGPNGSGKSTVFDTFAFMSECFFPPQLIGIEEPENYLHPKLLPELAEECRNASAQTQLLVTSHSPFFVADLQPNELRVLYRDEHGYTQARRVADMPRARKMFDAGGKARAPVDGRLFRRR